MKLLPKFYRSYLRRVARKKVALRHKLVNQSVYTMADIMSDASVRAYIAVDGTRIVEIADKYREKDDKTPTILRANADRMLGYIRHQYFLAHRHTILQMHANGNA